MDEVDTLVSAIRARIEGLDREDELVELRPSVFEGHEARWRALGSALGRALPRDLEHFFRRCDGFVDPRYTNLYGVEGFLDNVEAGLARDDALFFARVGDGLGLDDKAIYFLPGLAFDDGEPRWVYEDYVWTFDEELAAGFRARVLEAHREEIEQELPLWHDGVGNATSKEEADRVHYGPCRFTQLLEYVLDTARQA